MIQPWRGTNNENGNRDTAGRSRSRHKPQGELREVPFLLADMHGGNMVFHSEIDHDLSEGVCEQYDGALVVEFDLGYIPEKKQIVIMSVELHPAYGGRIDEPVSAYEFMFGIRIKESERPYIVSEPDFTVNGVNTYVPKEQRAAVLGLVCECLRQLISHAGCSEVTFSTYYQGTPNKALAKYGALGQTLEEIGFSLATHFLHSDERHYWHYIKP